MYDIKYALFSLLTQSLKPDMIILWLGEEQFPNREDDISEEILNLKKFGLTIKWCRDIKSYKKLIPALKEFPDDIIITVDDDIYYEKDMLEKLYTEYLKNPNTIVCSMGTEITFCGSDIAPNKKWKNTGEKSLSPLNVCLSGSGMLHPPFSSGIVCKDILNEELFMKLCPTTDDLWFWAMYVLNGRKINLLDFFKMNNFLWVNLEKEQKNFDFGEKSLWQENVFENGGNDKAVKNLIEYYPKLSEILQSERRKIEEDKD